MFVNNAQNSISTQVPFNAKQPFANLPQALPSVLINLILDKLDDSSFVRMTNLTKYLISYSKSNLETKQRKDQIKLANFMSLAFGTPADPINLIVGEMDILSLIRMSKLSKLWAINPEIMRKKLFLKIEYTFKKIPHHIDKNLEIAKIQFKLAQIDPLYLDEAKKAAKDFAYDPNNEKSQLLFEIIKFEAKIIETKIENMSKVKDKDNLDELTIEIINSFDALKETIKSIKSEELKDQALLEIVKVESKWDVEIAKVTALSIKSEELKCKALLEIAKFDPMHDFTELKKIATASHSSNLMLDIVKLEVQYDIEEAKRTAELIQDKVLKIDAYLEIAKVSLANEYEVLLAKILEMGKSLDIHQRGNMLLKIVKMEIRFPRFFPKRADQFARMIKDPSTKAKALLEVLTCYRTHGNYLETRRMVADIIDLPLYENIKKDDLLLYEIAINVGKSDLLAAEDIIKNVSDPFLKIQFNFELSNERLADNIHFFDNFNYDILEEENIVIEKEVRGVEITCPPRKNDLKYRRACAMFELAKNSSKPDFTEVKIANKSQTANRLKQISTGNPRYPYSFKSEQIEYPNDHLTLNIVKEEIKYDMMTAIQTADSIRDPGLKALAYLEIAKAVRD